MWLSENVTKLADQSELQADVTLMLVFDAVCLELTTENCSQ